MSTVPPEYRGLWRRRLIATPQGVDRLTTVYWLQTASLYADLRVPDDTRPCAGVAAASPAELARLARQQGFAGALAADGDVLRWQRWLDYQPPGPPDVGRVRRDGELLIEDGVHADYREEWERVAGDSDDVVALQLDTDLDARGMQAERAGVLVATAGYFMLAIARARALPLARDLAELVASGAYTLEDKRAFLDCTIDFGTRDAGGCWRVRHSTRPEHEGCEFTALHGRWQEHGRAHCLQLRAPGLLRQWQVIERGPAFAGLPGAAP